MPAGPRIRANNAYGITTDNPLTAIATTFNSAQLILLPAVSSAHAVIVLDPKRVFGQPEIVIVTAHTGLSTTATITRAAYGTVARSHPVGTAWAHVAVDEDYAEILTSTTRPSDPYVGQIIFETDTVSHKFYNGTIWNSAPPVGTILAYGGISAPSGYLLCDGLPQSRTTYADLFAVIDVNYGPGDGSTTFNMPNLKGRVPAGRDVAQVEFDSFTDNFGEKTVVLDATKLPQHAHSVTDPQHNHGQNGHGHGTGNHDHFADDNGDSGGHVHSIAGGDFGFKIGYRTDGAANGLVAGGLERLTFSNLDSNGVHNHTITVSPKDNFMNNNVTAVNVASGSGISVNNAGVVNPSHNNLQPYTVVNYIIKF